MVSDAAAKVEGVSLNDHLLPGPDYLKSIVGVLRRAREGKIAVTGDIKEMFHRVLIRKDDQDSQRFLWRDGDSTKPPDTYVLTVMTYGSVCSPTSAQWVKNHHASQYINSKPRAVEAITNRHYVDDMLDSFETEQEAITTVKDVIEIYAAAGMEIRNWLSNSRLLMETFNKQQETITSLSLNFDADQTDKILGIYWNLKSDAYTFKLSFIRADPDLVSLVRVPTKREVLKIVMAIFDPHGYAAPVLVHAKILLQKIWRKEIGWDEKIDENLFKQWNGWRI
jgi:hypothetical protein